MLFGQNVDGVFLRIRRYDVRVIGCRPGAGDRAALQRRVHRHLRNVLGAVCVALDFGHAHVGFAIAGVRQGRHPEIRRLLSTDGGRDVSKAGTSTREFFDREKWGYLDLPVRGRDFEVVKLRFLHKN